MKKYIPELLLAIAITFCFFIDNELRRFFLIILSLCFYISYRFVWFILLIMLLVCFDSYSQDRIFYVKQVDYSNRTIKDEYVCLTRYIHKSNTIITTQTENDTSNSYFVLTAIKHRNHEYIEALNCRTKQIAYIRIYRYYTVIYEHVEKRTVITIFTSPFD